MFRALVWKEVRACLLPAVFCLLLSGWLGFSLAVDSDLLLLKSMDVFNGKHHHGGSLFDDERVLLLIGVASILGGAILGVALFAWEMQPPGVLALLTHSARRRAAIVGAKIVAGLATYTVSVALPILVGGAGYLYSGSSSLPLSGFDSAYIWMLVGAGAVSCLGLLAFGLPVRQGMPARECIRHLLRLLVVGGLIAGAVASPSFALAAVCLLGGALFAFAGAFSGFVCREF